MTPPLVMVHGFMGGSAQWEPQIEALSTRFDVITVDLPGFAANADMLPIDNIGAFADWVLVHLRNKGITRFHLLGHSMGGMIAQEMVHRTPDAVHKLVLYGTGASGNLPDRFESISDSKQRAIKEGPRRTARRIAATWFLETENAVRYEACAKIAEQSSLPAILYGLDAMAAWDGRDRLDTIKAETMVLWGDKDRTYAWPQTEQLWRTIPDTNLAVVPQTAHAVHMEAPEHFNKILLEFL